MGSQLETMMADGTKGATDKAAEQEKTTMDAAADRARQAADAMREAGQKARDTFSEQVVDPARRAGEAIKASGHKMAESGSTIGLKLLDQAEVNTREAFAAMRAAAHAKDWSEVLKVQGDFLREQGSRSMSQAREVGELIAQFGRDAVSPLKGGKD